MKRLLIAGLVLALLVPACALAQEAFTGTWKMDPATFHESGKPLVMHLKDGVYRCNCTPPIEVKADGADHAVTGHSGYDTVAVKVLDDHSILESDKKDGQLVSEETFTVAADGKTATSVLARYDNGSKIMGGTAVFERLGKGEPGSHAVAGSWAFGHVTEASGQALNDTYKVSGDDISYQSGASDASYTAKINGKSVPYMRNGKQDGTVSVKRLDKNTLRETYATDGKITAIGTMTVSADGKTLESSFHNPKTGTTSTWVSDKQ
jgi:hypothetical protein